ncbi:hypothetical protein KB1_17300 [Cutibacterium modestum]|uniref:Uncharacterized protein n=1 Tax=Cutibacterium modestum TaxID=2559073 RepID=A0AAD1KRF3_9ACTN|nr:hypothetical protein KB1_17300 [Cutibacterium modestum]
MVACTDPKADSRIHKVANRKSRQLHSVVSLISLRAPPGNHLEVLKGDSGAAQHLDQRSVLCGRMLVRRAITEVRHD